MTADGEAVVFHDYGLDRLTAKSGPITARTASEAKAIPLTEADGDTIPSLDDILFLVDGRVPLLIEIKDQDGALGPMSDLWKRPRPGLCTAVAETGGADVVQPPQRAGLGRVDAEPGPWIDHLCVSVRGLARVRGALGRAARDPGF